MPELQFFQNADFPRALSKLQNRVNFSFFTQNCFPSILLRKSSVIANNIKN